MYSFLSPEESRAQTHVWAVGHSGMGPTPVSTSSRLPSVPHPFPCHTLWLYGTFQVQLCLHPLQTPVPGRSCLFPSAHKHLLFTSLDPVRCHPLWEAGPETSARVYCSPRSSQLCCCAHIITQTSPDCLPCFCLHLETVRFL